MTKYVLGTTKLDGPIDKTAYMAPSVALPYIQVDIKAVRNLPLSQFLLLSHSLPLSLTLFLAPSPCLFARVRL